MAVNWALLCVKLHGHVCNRIHVDVNLLYSTIKYDSHFSQYVQI